jgi:hypothetical protein
MQIGHLRSAVIPMLCLCVQFRAFSPAAGEQMFKSDEWITECSAEASDCSITVPFWQGQGYRGGSFALVVMLQTANIGIVGQPVPIRAVLRVDKNPPIECRQEHYCIFSSAQAIAAINQLNVGSLILIDVFTAKGTFGFSLTAKGYQAGIAKIRAWGYRLPRY